MTPRRPALPQVWLVRIEHARPPRRAGPLREDAGPHEAPDGLAPNPELRGDLHLGGALAIQGEDRLVAGQARRAVGGLLLVRARGRSRRRASRDCLNRAGIPGGFGDGLPGAVHGRRHLPQERVLAREHPCQRLADVGQHGETVCHLDRVGRPLAGAIGVRACSVTGDHADTGMSGQPGRERGGRPILEEVHDAALFEIDQDRAIALPAPARPIVDTQHARRHGGRRLRRVDDAQKGRAAADNPERTRQPGSRGTPEGEANLLQRRALRVRPSGADAGECRETLGENPPRAGGVGAAEATDAQAKDQRAPRDRQIGQRARVGRVDAPRAPPTQWAGSPATRRRKVHYDDVISDLDSFEMQANQMGKERGERQECDLRMQELPHGPKCRTAL